MKKTLAWVIVIAVLAGIAFFFLFPKKAGEPPVPVEPPRAEAPAPPPPPAPEEPGVRHPLPAVEEGPLPALAESDAAAKEALGDVFGTEALERFYLEGIIRRVVTTVDNLPRQKVALRVLPVKPVGGQFQVTSKDDTLVIGPSNTARYTPYVKLAQAADVKQAAAFYRRHYPLFQQAYEELGYPGRYFNDRLVAVIDHLLAAPEVQGPIRLTQPKVLYQFADPELEALSAGQKFLVRVGPENAAALKSRLRALRDEVAAAPPAASDAAKPQGRIEGIRQIQ
ncbi:MAG TPA: DUF3014 domain-containing protein [Pelomicrobium sp.]|nr:DUF3014 domain-containing protein [Pelomicrobium sp.]